jgi:SET domain-containing protein
VARSKINGEGVFTKEFIPAGARVIECRGIIVGPEDITEDMRVMQIGPDVYLAEDVNNPNLDDYLNHCCEPNLGFLEGTLELFALRDIEAGEELFIDYSTCMNEEGWTIRCGCRAPSCRGRVQSHCDLTEKDQRRLKRISLAYLRSEANVPTLSACE